ncbi:MAG: hypothetical protein IKG81_05605 [Bacteroidales bacterium]|nr:hypothetical protein [Bacteroidales bacterium]
MALDSVPKGGKQSEAKRRTKHYEYLDTVRKRTEETRLEHELWHRAVEEFREAFGKEDKAFKQYRASDHTSALQKADEERDKLYASLRDTIKAYAKFPIAETAPPRRATAEGHQVP